MTTIYNTNLHQVLREEPEDLLIRLAAVEHLREGTSMIYTYYVAAEDEYQFNQNIWQYVHGQLAMPWRDSQFIFSLTIPDLLLQFLKSCTSIELANNPSVLLCLRLYIEHPTKRDLLKSELYPQVYLSAMNLVDEYFMNYVSKVDSEEYLDRFTQKAQDLEQSYKRKYEEVAVSMGLSKTFTHQLLRMEAGHLGYQDLQLSGAYLYKRDWDPIVRNGEYDEMGRSEGSTQALVAWKNAMKLQHDIPDDDPRLF